MDKNQIDENKQQKQIRKKMAVETSEILKRIKSVMVMPGFDCNEHESGLLFDLLYKAEDLKDTLIQGDENLKSVFKK